MKKIIKNWLGLNDIELLHKKINNLNERLVLMHDFELERTADLARLILDMKCGFVSHESFDFICRMNLKISEYKKQIPLEMVEKINQQK